MQIYLRVVRHRPKDQRPTPFIVLIWKEEQSEGGLCHLVCLTKVVEGIKCVGSEAYLVHFRSSTPYGHKRGHSTASRRPLEDFEK